MRDLIDFNSFTDDELNTMTTRLHKHRQENKSDRVQWNLAGAMINKIRDELAARAQVRRVAKTYRSPTAPAVLHC